MMNFVNIFFGFSTFSSFIVLTFASRQQVIYKEQKDKDELNLKLFACSRQVFTSKLTSQILGEGIEILS